MDNRVGQSVAVFHVLLLASSSFAGKTLGCFMLFYSRMFAPIAKGWRGMRSDGRKSGAALFRKKFVA
jgi:hypothetical protein